MKKLLTLAAIFALVFTACEQPTNEDNPGIKLPNLTIRNESSFVLTNVTFSGISFAASGNDLPTSSQSVKPLTANDLNKAGYITFTRKDIGIACRTEAIAIGNENLTFTFLDTTVVEEVANAGNKKSLAQITFISKVTLEVGGLTVPRNDIVSIEGIATFTKQTEFTLRNTGVGKLLLTGTQPVKITGTGADAFSVAQPSSSEIAPNGSLTFKINFSPSAIQVYNATVTITSNDQDGDFVFSIRASGVPPKPIASVFFAENEVSQEGTIDAGEVLITLSKNISVVIKNTGQALLTLETANITIAGADAEAFTKTTNPGGSISPGQQSSFVIECKPTKQGENNAVLTIPTNDDSRNPVVVFLKVTGVRGTGVLQLSQGSTVIAPNSPTPVDMGRVEIGSSGTLAFTIKNTGNLPLALTGESPVQSSHAAFTIIQPANKTLNPNVDTTTFTVQYTPTSEGEQPSSTITIANNSDGGPFIFTVKGAGYVKRPQISIVYGTTVISENSLINAGDVLITQSKDITVIIKNTGEEVLNITTADITITGANLDAFTRTTAPAATVQAGGQTQFTIRCAPTTEGENNATLAIPSDDINRSLASALLRVTGVKGSGILELKQDNTVIANNAIMPFDFGRTALGSSKSLVFNIKNAGNIPLVLTGTPAVTSSNAAFTITTQPANTTINPEATVPFVIQYTPTAEQEDTGTITITNDSNAALFVFNVKATGYVRRPQISVFHDNTEILQYGTINIGDVEITQPKDITVIIRNTGEELLTIDTTSISLTGTDVALFTRTTNPATNVSAGSQTQFVIRYAPTEVGVNQATLTIPSNDSFRSPYVVYLNGNAVPPSNVTYQIGDTGPAGGIIFYDAGAVINGWRYLEASLTDFNAQWAIRTSNPGGYINGTGLSIGDGKQNTQRIVAALNQWGETGRAAQLCANLNINGFNDWFLPSRDELNMMYQRRTAIGNFSTGYYWSSSEQDYEWAWGQSFSNGTQYSNRPKNGTQSVRAIRAF